MLNPDQVSDECEIAEALSWENQWQCNTHDVWYRKAEEHDLCPVGEVSHLYLKEVGR